MINITSVDNPCDNNEVRKIDRAENMFMSKNLQANTEQLYRDIMSI